MYRDHSEKSIECAQHSNLETHYSQTQHGNAKGRRKHHVSICCPTEGAEGSQQM